MTSFGLPILITWMGYVPFIGPLLAKTRQHITWPSSIATYDIRSLPYALGRATTVGESLYVILFLVLNIVFTSVGYESRQPNAWNPTVHYEIMSYVLGRTGVFAYIFLPLLFFFAGRNNILLWLTNWSHSTYLVLHRWVARIFKSKSFCIRSYRLQSTCRLECTPWKQTSPTGSGESLPQYVW